MNWEKVLIVLLILNIGSNFFLIFSHYSSPGLGFGGDADPVFYTASAIGSNSTSILEDEQASLDEWDLSGSEPEEAIQEPVLVSRGNQTGTMSPQATGPVQQPATEPALKSTSASNSSPDGWVDYTSSMYHFSLRYPQTWELTERPAGSPRTVLILTAPVETACEETGTRCYKYTANMSFEIDQNPFTLIPDEYFVRAVADLQAKYSITTTSKSAPCIISGIRAYQIEFYTRDKRGNPDRSYMQYYVIVDGKAYIISYTGRYSTWDNVYSNNKGDAQQIIDSIVFKRDFSEG
ncbi:MAG: hypothetical protein LUQ33_07865 [Methanoregulaceae archaeon]|nr:hypothetical protein [Methanoregulaceae archaeon]